MIWTKSDCAVTSPQCHCSVSWHFKRPSPECNSTGSNGCPRRPDQEPFCLSTIFTSEWPATSIISPKYNSTDSKSSVSQETETMSVDCRTLQVSPPVLPMIGHFKTIFWEETQTKSQPQETSTANMLKFSPECHHWTVCHFKTIS